MRGSTSENEKFCQCRRTTWTTEDGEFMLCIPFLAEDDLGSLRYDDGMGHLPWSGPDIAHRPELLERLVLTVQWLGLRASKSALSPKEVELRALLVRGIECAEPYLENPYLAAVLLLAARDGSVNVSSGGSPRLASLPQPRTLSPALARGRTVTELLTTYLGIPSREAFALVLRVEEPIPSRTPPLRPLAPLERHWEHVAAEVWGMDRFRALRGRIQTHFDASHERAFSVVMQNGKAHLFLHGEVTRTLDDVLAVVHECTHIDHLLSHADAGRDTTEVLCYEREYRALAAEWSTLEALLPEGALPGLHRRHWQWFHEEWQLVLFRWEMLLWKNPDAPREVRSQLLEECPPPLASALSRLDAPPGPPLLSAVYVAAARAIREENCS